MSGAFSFGVAMLSYQHIYHAGNFADVHKHAILVGMLKALCLKATPMAVLDTHAGRGIYNLSSTEAEKTREHEHGISHIWRDRSPTSPLRHFFEAIEKHNPDEKLVFYPGTAQIARGILRPSDRLICVEKHPGEFEELKKILGAVPHTLLQNRDGFECLIEMVPFPERRGAVVIDPSYEIKTEYREVPRRLFRAWKKWPQGCYFLWYPVMEGGAEKEMIFDLHQSGIRDILISEIRLEEPPEAHYRMFGSGVAIVNPPWPEETLRSLTLHIAHHMHIKTQSDVYWLDNKKADIETRTLS